MLPAEPQHWLPTHQGQPELFPCPGLGGAYGGTTISTVRSGVPVSLPRVFSSSLNPRVGQGELGNEQRKASSSQERELFAQQRSLFKVLTV